jgi:hypothetical protein
MVFIDLQHFNKLKTYHNGHRFSRFVKVCACCYTFANKILHSYNELYPLRKCDLYHVSLEHEVADTLPTS